MNPRAMQGIADDLAERLKKLKSVTLSPRAKERGRARLVGMRVVYISGPCRSKRGMNGMYENINVARKVAREYWLQGFSVICPHTNTIFMDGTDTQALPYDMFLEGDLELLRRSDIVVMLSGWEESIGATAEHALAKKLKKKIIYR